MAISNFFHSLGCSGNPCSCSQNTITTNGTVVQPPASSGYTNTTFGTLYNGMQVMGNTTSQGILGTQGQYQYAPPPNYAEMTYNEIKKLNELLTKLLEVFPHLKFG